MDTVTYPDSRVIEEFGAHFVAVRVNTREADPGTAALQREFRQIWTPTFVFLDPHRIEVRRAVGYLPPEELLAEAELARGLGAMLRADFARAFGIFRGVVQGHTASSLVPEALYWAGVAGYRRDGSRDELMRQWSELRERFPQSPWWIRASFISA